MKKLLWLGDAGCQSGFAKSTHGILDTLRDFYEIQVIGLNYKGDPSARHDYPYDIWPAAGGHPPDGWGINRIPELVNKYSFDVAIVQNDPWNFRRYLKTLVNIPVVGIVAVDGLNCRGADLNALTSAVFWTEFGAREAKLGGYEGPASVIPLGVDEKTFNPRNRKEARARLGFPKRFQDSFIVGSVGRNQHRKRLDLTIAYFAEWVKTYQVDDAYLYLHVAPTGDAGFDCMQLARYYGIQHRTITHETHSFKGPDDNHMADTYASFDVQLSTTQGEGFGLCTLEGMACGIPQIVPDWSALGDWCRDRALKVPCTSTAATPNNINVIGGVIDRELTVAALNVLYKNEERRVSLGLSGFELSSEPQFRWSNVGQRFTEVLDKALAMPYELKKAEPVGV